MKFYEEDDFVEVKRRRRNEPSFWHGLNRVLGVLVLVGLLCGVSIMFYPVWQKQQDMRARLASLEGEHAVKTAALQGDLRKIELLRHDQEYLETIARDRLNLMKTGETIFRVEMPRS